MKKILINQIYRWHSDQPPAALVDAFNAALACSTMPPETKMRMHAIGDMLDKQVGYAKKTHQDLQASYMVSAGEGENLTWIGDDEDARKASETAFLEDFAALLNTEIEIKPIPLSALQKASDRYWLLHERGLGNGAKPIDEAISALAPIIHDDINPPEPTIHTNGDAPKPPPQKPAHRPPVKRKRK